MHYQKILFILKKRNLYDSPYAEVLSSGLYNSSLFICDMLNQNGIEAKLVQVIDNNNIDKEVSEYRPTTVVIEALWVVPEKFDVLHKLHPNVNWIVRLHSEMPFLASEGMAIEWIYGYSEKSRLNNLKIASNSLKMYNDLVKIGVNNVIYLPNYYPVNAVPHNLNTPHKDYIDIGCFGAIRPMKNQLIQAVAAIEFGDKIGKSVRFHVNSERIERGDSALRNIVALFENQGKHQLIEHAWVNHDEFLMLVSQMDLGLQVSFNETFNIVAADFASQNVPIVGSKEIEWLNHFYKADTTSSDDIVAKLKLANYFKKFNLQRLNKTNLIDFVNKAKTIWLNDFKKH